MESGWDPTLYALIWAALAVNAAAWIWHGTRSTPAAVRQLLEDTAEAAHQAVSSAEKLQRDWDQEKIALAGILENLENVAETIGKRRARITAENQRRTQHEAHEDPRMALRRRAGMI